MGEHVHHPPSRDGDGCMLLSLPGAAGRHRVRSCVPYQMYRSTYSTVYRRLGPRVAAEYCTSLSITENRSDW